MSGVRRVVSCRRIYDPEAPELQASLLKPQLSGKTPISLWHKLSQCSCRAVLTISAISAMASCHTGMCPKAWWQVPLLSLLTL